MKKIFLPIACLSIAACSSGGGDDAPATNDNNNTPPASSTPVATGERNVAASDNGATVSASANAGNAALVIDGNTASDSFWSASATNDSITVDFGAVITMKDFTLYTNDTSINTGNPSKITEISEDGTNWLSVGALDADITCVNSSLGQGKVFCQLLNETPARYYRVTITATTNPEAIQIHEIDVTGQ